MTLLALHLAVVAAYAGFQWTVQVLTYRQFPAVPAEAFVAYELAHQRRISFVVGPLFLGLLTTTALLALAPPAGVPGWAPPAAVALLAVVLATTVLGAVPAHRRLSEGFDAGTHRRLLRADAVRVVAATANLAVAVWLVAVPA